VDGVQDTVLFGDELGGLCGGASMSTPWWARYDLMIRWHINRSVSCIVNWPSGISVGGLFASKLGQLVSKALQQSLTTGISAVQPDGFHLCSHNQSAFRYH
jgi:hypothetical protein